ncbi:hypothetical protein EDD17DRAFT_1503361 [Pisolithus thermaeus]|nr:hypothetical protein EDD17DRAFT_1503361 [Pisolithus thermaeus]
MPVLKLRPIPAFYDGKPNLLPVLSSQVEIAFLPGRPVCVSTSESMTVLDLDFLSGTRGEKIPRTTTSRATTPTAMTSRAMTPRAKIPRVVTPRAQSPMGQMPAPTAKGKLVTIKAPSSDSKCSESSPAPSKGYNLEEQLGWGDDGFKSLKAVAEFPDLSTFKNCWSVLNLIQMHLKYLSSRAWQEKRITDGLSEAVKGGKRI